ncbi:Alpha/beta hydrolase family protein [Streptomyces misionensis JCM 4497]
MLPVPAVPDRPADRPTPGTPGGFRRPSPATGTARARVTSPFSPRLRDTTASAHARRRLAARLASLWHRGPVSRLAAPGRLGAGRPAKAPRRLRNRLARALRQALPGPLAPAFPRGPAARFAVPRGRRLAGLSAARRQAGPRRQADPFPGGRRSAGAPAAARTPRAVPVLPGPSAAARPSPSSPAPLAGLGGRRDTDGVRTVKAAAAAVTAVLAAGMASVAAGRLASDAALKTTGSRPLPTEPRLTVHGTAAGQITLTRDLASLRPGSYGLAGDGSHAVVGPVLADTRPTADTVVRRLDRVTHGTLAPGDPVWLTPNLYVGNPRTALGLDHTDVDVPGELGPLPAWFLPGSRDVWVIAVHGLGTTREHAMNLMGFLNGRHLPVLALAYRGDLGAPRPADGLNHFGETEWRDLDAAIHHAVRHGARRVVLLGWSTGATMALRAAEHSAMRDHIAGLVLDSPVLSWEATLRALARARHTPPPLLPLAVRAAQGRAGLHADRVAEITDPERLTVPTLIIHGPGDRVAPWEFSRMLAERRPDRVALHTVPGAPHAAMWNPDPKEYEERLRRFLTPLM